MREIIFRAKRKDNGEWVYGYYARFETIREVFYVIYTDCADDYSGGLLAHCYDVKPETVGQYTGLTDKNGTKIFEGDIVKTKYGRLCEVVWFSSNRYQSWGLKPLETKHRYPDAYDMWASNNLEVIGNIYDNPELLEGNI
jgi:hypothetical protein